MVTSILNMEAVKQSRQLGIREGKREGIREGQIEMLLQILQVKGFEDRKLIAKIKQEQNLEKLKNLASLAVTAGSVQELQTVFDSHQG